MDFFPPQKLFWFYFNFGADRIFNSFFLWGGKTKSWQRTMKSAKHPHTHNWVINALKFVKHERFSRTFSPFSAVATKFAVSTMMTSSTTTTTSTSFSKCFGSRCDLKIANPKKDNRNRKSRKKGNSKFFNVSQDKPQT